MTLAGSWVSVLCFMDGLGRLKDKVDFIDAQRKHVYSFFRVTCLARSHVLVLNLAQREKNEEKKEKKSSLTENREMNDSKLLLFFRPMPGFDLQKKLSLS